MPLHTLFHSNLCLKKYIDNGFPCFWTLDVRKGFFAAGAAQGLRKKTVSLLPLFYFRARDINIKVFYEVLLLRSAKKPSEMVYRKSMVVGFAKWLNLSGNHYLKERFYGFLLGGWIRGSLHRYLAGSWQKLLHPSNKIQHFQWRSKYCLWNELERERMQKK